jgi:phosphohistidine swiveling domain-containing protein
VLHGAGGSDGVVVGPARLISAQSSDIAKVRPGDILVMRSLDLGFTPLFLAAPGLVSEVGSALSHGAVIAREYGVPAVLGVRAVTTTVKDGERLRIDGARGIVERLDA